MHIIENKGGFATFKTRDTGRADMVVPGLIKQEGAWAALSTAKWLPLIKQDAGPGRLPAPRRRHHGDAQFGGAEVAFRW